MSKPYLSPSAKAVDNPITIRTVAAEFAWRYQIDLGGAGYLHIDSPDLNALLITAAEALFDDNTLTMDTAERLAYLSQAVLADREVPKEDRTDPDGDFPEFPPYTDDDAPEA